MRLVSLCPSITETLVALGLKDALVGVTRYCMHPKEAFAGISRVGGTKSPDLAAIRDLKPDLVFCNGERVERGTGFTFAYLIWKDPWMTVGPRTYICDLLRTVGGSNCLEGEEGSAPDYPTFKESEILAASPDVVILPDEPYRFREEHAQYFRQRLPASRVVLVSGDDFCWHGVRTLRGLEAAAALAGVPTGGAA